MTYLSSLDFRLLIIILTNSAPQITIEINPRVNSVIIIFNPDLNEFLMFSPDSLSFVSMLTLSIAYLKY